MHGRRNMSKKFLEIVEEKNCYQVIYCHCVKYNAGVYRKKLLSSDILSLCIVQRRCSQYIKQNQKQTVNNNKHFKLHIM
jgi:hypothetical protein